MNSASPRDRCRSTARRRTAADDDPRIRQGNRRTHAESHGGYSPIKAAIDDVKIDESGKENMCSAVGAAIDKYGTQATRAKRRLVLVIVSDESGDDGHPGGCRHRPREIGSRTDLSARPRSGLRISIRPHPLEGSQVRPVASPANQSRSGDAARRMPAVGRTASPLGFVLVRFRPVRAGPLRVGNRRNFLHPAG